MLARLQQLIVFGLVAAIAGWTGYVLHLGHSVWAFGGAFAIAGGYAVVLGVEFCLLENSYAKDAKNRPSTRQLITSWRDEVLIAPRVFLWRQPFRSRAIPDRPAAPGKPGRRAIVFVHGFVCNRALWNPWLTWCIEHDIAFVAVNLEPVFGSIDNYVSPIELAVRRVEAATGLAPILVAHSMGGLAIRAWLAKVADPDRFHRVITVASPHGGTRMARHGRTTNSLQMRPQSAWLQALARAESTPLHARFTCFWSHCDNIVFPTAGATLPGADNRHLVATPHVAMAFHPDVFAEVLRLIEADRPL
ncbi:MAG: alpha/beta fold hydrolase [Caldimonas sp.]